MWYNKGQDVVQQEPADSIAAGDGKEQGLAAHSDPDIKHHVEAAECIKSCPDDTWKQNPGSLRLCST